MRKCKGERGEGEEAIKLQASMVFFIYLCSIFFINLCTFSHFPTLFGYFDLHCREFCTIDGYQFVK